MTDYMQMVLMRYLWLSAITSCLIVDFTCVQAFAETNQNKEIGRTALNKGHGSEFCITEFFEPAKNFSPETTAVVYARKNDIKKTPYLKSILEEFHRRGHSDKVRDGHPVLKLVLEASPLSRPYRFVGAAVLCPTPTGGHAECSNYTFYIFERISPEELVNALTPHLGNSERFSRTCWFSG
jgi:hypothetical protein